MRVTLMYTQTVRSKKNKGGRPPAENPVGVVVTFRLTPTEAKKLHTLADANGMKLSAYLRSRVSKDMED